MPIPKILPLFTCLLLCLASVTAQAEPRSPLFSYLDEQGSVQTLNTGNAKLTAVHFWATWCVPCVAELPEVDATQAKYAKQGLRIVAISMDTKTEKVREFFTAHHITHLPPYLDNGIVSFRAAGIRGLPATLFFNAEGKEIARTEGPMPWSHQENVDFLEANLK